MGYSNAIALLMLGTEILNKNKQIHCGEMLKKINYGKQFFSFIALLISIFMYFVHEPCKRLMCSSRVRNRPGILQYYKL